MVLDYSKFAHIDTSSDEEEDTSRKATSSASSANKKVNPAEVFNQPTEVTKVQAEKPREAQGSVWNTGNYHWEEQHLDDWGKARIRELVHDQPGIHEFEFSGSNIHFVHSLSIVEMEGECWNHIRKGKHVVGYNFEIKFSVAGKVVAGPRQEDIKGELEYDFVVDDPDGSPRFTFTMGQQLPFISNIRQLVLASLTKKLQTFVNELQNKGSKSAAAASERPGVTPTAVPTAVQVGKHNPGGKRID